MIRLERIVVENYKNITKADLVLGNLNIIVGENNAGKTNFLESISFLNYLINGSINEIALGLSSGGRFNTYNFIGHSGFRIEITYSNHEKDLIFNYSLWLSSSNTIRPLEIIAEHLQYKKMGNTGISKRIFSRNSNKVEYGEQIKKDDIINNLQNHVSTIRLLNLIVNSGKINNEYKAAIEGLNEILSTPTFYFSNYLLKSNDVKFENTTRLAKFDLENEIEQIKESADFESFQRALTELLHITYLEIFRFDNSNRPAVLFRHRNFEGLKDIQSQSDGSILLFALITKLYSNKSDIIFIEEPENSIHPKALYSLIKLILKFSHEKQFVITTHSPYLLNMVKPEDVFVASIGEMGMSKIEKLPNVKEIKKKLAKGFMNFGDIVFSQPEPNEEEV